ncbi:MAG: glycosyltransferase family 39 protein [Bacteroidetes bacterium]|nr:glycosyltransferase family 39 protein [Bacteroidota bacterium]
MRSAVFILVILLLSFYYNYHRIISWEPKGAHVWRQTDGASLALNYYNDGLDFFKPRIHNQLKGTGKTVAEFPFFYYIAAVLYNVFEANDMYLRLVHLLAFYLGLFALFKMTALFIKDGFWQFVIPVLLFTSPLLIYYANNFLPNIPSFALILIAWYFFGKYYQEQTVKWLWLAGLFFLLGGLIKMTALISFTAIGCLFVLERIPFVTLKEGKKLFVHSWQFISIFVGTFAMIWLWYKFGDLYREVEGNEYLQPKRLVNFFWNNSDWQNEQTWKRISTVWFDYLLYPPTFWLIPGILLVLIRHAGQISYRFFLGITFLCTGGSVLYMMLVFDQFMDHDYYFANMFIVVVFALLSLFMLMESKYPKLYNSLLLKTTVFMFLLMNIIYAREYSMKKYTMYEHEDLREVFLDPGLKNFLTSIGVTEKHRILSMPDGSPNNTLYFMNRGGWTGFNLGPYTSERIDELRERGAEFLVISDSIYLKQDLIQHVLDKPLGQYKTVFVFDIRTAAQ